MQPFAIVCTTCSSRLKVRDPRLVGQIVTCPSCGAMVEILPPADADGTAVVEVDPLDHAAGFQPQVLPVQHRLEEQAALLQQSHDAILICELAGNIRYWNPSAERVFGWSAAEACGLATAYVTLEPCAHASERGFACADLLAEAKPARVVGASGARSTCHSPSSVRTVRVTCGLPI